MTLHEMTADPSIRTHRTLEIHELPLPQGTERRYPRGFGTDVRQHLTGVCRDHRQADPVDRHAVAGCQIRSERRPDADAVSARRGFYFRDPADVLNEAGEHSPRSAYRDRGSRPSVRSMTTTPDRTPRTIGHLRDQALRAPRTVGR